jgi:acetolactate synthase-1/2/3 large subunit
LETAVRNNLNAVMIVNNNYSGGVGETSPFERGVSFAKVAEDFGCFGMRVEAPNDIRPALDKALASGRPAVVEIVSDTNVRAKRGWAPGEQDH